MAKNLNDRSSLQAMAYFEEGRHSSIMKIVFHPWFRFIKAFILKAGILDGTYGFIIACFHAYEVFLKYVKLWELERNR